VFFLNENGVILKKNLYFCNQVSANRHNMTLANGKKSFGGRLPTARNRSLER
jgi:hypothetical protein